jgi:hypothetical protein
MATKTVRNMASRPSIAELKEMADAGDARAMRKLDDWEQNFADVYSGDFSEVCDDGSCEYFGEPVNICCDENGKLLEIDHGMWAHPVPRRMSMAS